MKSIVSKILPCLLLTFVFISCEEEEKVCDDCQDAIDHMFHKIESNDCNPDQMENAMNSLKDECGLFSAQAFAGVMAHSCDNENITRLPECISNDDDIIHSFLYLKDVQVAINVLNTRDPDETVLVEVLDGTGGTGKGGVFQMQAGDNADHFIQTLDNGAEVDIVVSDIETEEVLLQKTVINRFWRSGYWHQVRTAQVQYIPLLDEYDIVFNYW